MVFYDRKVLHYILKKNSEVFSGYFLFNAVPISKNLAFFNYSGGVTQLLIFEVKNVPEFLKFLAVFTREFSFEGDLRMLDDDGEIKSDCAANYFNGILIGLQANEVFFPTSDLFMFNGITEKDALTSLQEIPESISIFLAKFPRFTQNFLTRTSEYLLPLLI